MSTRALRGGFSEKLGWSPQQYDQQQLAKGIEVELEHTLDRGLARQIAMDHLAEQVLAGAPQDYYDRLEQMEEGWQPGPSRPRRGLGQGRQRLVNAMEAAEKRAADCGNTDAQLQIIEDQEMLRFGAVRPGDMKYTKLWEKYVEGRGMPTGMRRGRQSNRQLQSNRRWTRAYINELPDDHFFWVAPGGEQDEQGRTHPLDLRSLPYKDKQGKVDPVHVSNALSRLRGTEDIPESEKPRIKKRICNVLERHGGECSTRSYRRNRDEDPTKGLRGERVTFWERDEEEPYATYGHWYTREAGEWFVPDWTSYSDYSGGLVCKANFRAFMRDFAPEDDGQPDWLKHLSGGWGTEGLAIHIADAPEEVWQWLGALEDYPLADEELHSELQLEAEEEAWENWAKADFVKQVAEVLGYELDECDEDAVYQLFQDAAEKANVYWEQEGDQPEVGIDIKRVADAVDEDDLPDCAKEVEED